LRPGDQVAIGGQNNIGAGRWWQIAYPGGPNGVGWVSASPDYSTAFNVRNVPVVAPPPTPAPPTPTYTPTPVPTVQQTSIVFEADRTRIQRGECVNIYWNVTNVKEVYYNGRGVPGENQGRRECPGLTEYFDLRVIKDDGSVETQTIRIEVEGGSFDTVEIELGEGVDFDDDGDVSRDGDDFKWVKDDDDREFKKWDDDDDLILVPVGPVGLEEIRREDCEWAVRHLDDQDSIDPFVGLAACFRTDERRIGKLRFKDVDDDEVKLEWGLW
jgi:hypothetical protein